MKEKTLESLRSFSLRHRDRCALCLDDGGDSVDRIRPHLGYVCCMGCGNSFHKPCFAVAVHTAKEKASITENFICPCCTNPQLFVIIGQRQTKYSSEKESTFDTREYDWKNEIPNSIKAESVEDETVLKNLLPKILQKKEDDDCWGNYYAQCRRSEVIVLDDDDDDEDEKQYQTQQSQLSREVIVIDDDDNEDEKQSQTQQSQLSQDHASSITNPVVHMSRTINMFSCSSRAASVSTGTKAVSATTQNAEFAPRTKRRHDDVGSGAGMCKEETLNNGRSSKRS